MAKKPSPRKIVFPVRSADGALSFRVLIFRPLVVGDPEDNMGHFTTKPHRGMGNVTSRPVTIQFIRKRVPYTLTFLQGSSRHHWLFQRGDEPVREVSNDEVETLTGQSDLFIPSLV